MASFVLGRVENIGPRPAALVRHNIFCSIYWDNTSLFDCAHVHCRIYPSTLIRCFIEKLCHSLLLLTAFAFVLYVIFRIAILHSSYFCFSVGRTKKRRGAASSLDYSDAWTFSGGQGFLFRKLGHLRAIGFLGVEFFLVVIFSFGRVFLVFYTSRVLVSELWLLLCFVSFESRNCKVSGFFNCWFLESISNSNWIFFVEVFWSSDIFVLFTVA